MNRSAEKALEFNKIREALAGLAETPGGRRTASTLTPSIEELEVSRALDETSEARRLIDQNERLSLAGLPEIDEDLDELKVAGHALDVQSFVRLAGFSSVAGRTKAGLERKTEELPLLSARARDLADLSPVEAAIRQVVDLDEEAVRDDASPELEKLRSKSRRLRARVAKILDATVSSRDNQKLLQEPIVTLRNNRPVVPVKAECRSQFPGIVHGASASGATIFVEPSGAVPLGNEIAALADREAAEVRRILRALTDRVRTFASELMAASQALSTLDFIGAKGRLSEHYRAVRPTLTTEDVLVLHDARHPLLEEPVPLTFRLSEGRRGLVFTGPNTGGKTVALKTAGLLALMAQSGLHVPASSSSTFPIFHSVFADIGDDQSIGSSLSTFSAHLAKIVEMERGLEKPALVILDEVGTGTDPAEGGALGTALVEHFLERGALVLASTHHGLLKAYALTSEGVDAASFDFDPESYRPTYRIIEGAAGRSMAFEMAERLGLNPAIVNRARRLQGERDRQVGELVERLEAGSARIEKEQQALAEARARLEADKAQEHRERRHRLRDFRASLEKELDQTRGQLRSLVGEAREAVKEIRASRREDEKRLLEVERKIEAGLEAIATRVADEPAERRADLPIAPGARVLVSSFGVEGDVVAIQGKEAEVLVHDKKLRLPLESLEALARKAPASAEGVVARFAKLPAPKVVKTELNLVGCTVEEAIERADKFLDDALLSEYRQVRLIHGHGTGRLKNALREWLSEHPQVGRHESENRGGVTVVEFKD
ncbi:MAG TPA: endonuclease MutS2 [Vicinamibacteria bacterium]|nr:endonuclease MutS2 [Vicinamibacteria bacterium]